MTHRYDTTLGLPYVRVCNITIEYGTSSADYIKIQGIEKQAIVQSDGETFLGEGVNGSFSKTFSKTDVATGSFPIINIATGEETGSTMSNADLFTAFTSFIRKIQKEPR
jgi:uncharacterized protein (DUF342 family)